MSEITKCSAPGCDKPADKIVAGLPFCANPKHRAAKEDSPVAQCALAGCGLPAVRRVDGRDYCPAHATHAAAHWAA